MPPGATAIAAAPAPGPTATPAVLYLPETGQRNGGGLNPVFYIVLVLLLGVSLSGLLIWRARHE
ncbi:MAG: hypothetical protein D6768_05910 [Chloroflexi bacterium]|nr:MAG: hypothetical protein D6768_05910 [Chloroflexota bacterium]